ncbi:hypothetical protein U879_16935 [Defluviimonas sp. 20V17]|uniref:Uncharacterized protein n=1 Tax=Allgaiera indica TaxID=765699 RepID=A0AAN4ZY92_9RHOB|nr:hypothetical protein [Allgaiera indica]KDB02479.1 hypothetical protein U879_16935 [Defluviimonas sp. 20V17]GHD98735.1 hypothetical protein GCM10008024_03440 [Allgaiera indica]SDW07373.1 hypothetical protein SAMN05444006_101206 [Allgaiera indica]
MEQKPRKSDPTDKPAPSAREERLKAALKANIARRKAQARAQAQARGDDSNDKTT